MELIIVTLIVIFLGLIKYPKITLLLLFLLFFTITSPSFSYYFFLGWAIFLIDVIPQMDFKPMLLLGGFLCLLVFMIGIHFFSAWLYTSILPDALIRWQKRWTLAGSVIILLLFMTGISTIGLAHQIIWLATSKESLFFDIHYNFFGGTVRVFIPQEKRRIEEGLKLAKPAKVAINEFYRKLGQFPKSHLCAEIEQAGSILLNTAMQNSPFSKSVKNSIPRNVTTNKIFSDDNSYNPLDILNNYNKSIPLKNDTPSITIREYGIITITYQHDLIPEIENGTIILKPCIVANTIKWDCTGGTIPQAYRPAECQLDSGEYSLKEWSYTR